MGPGQTPQGQGAEEQTEVAKGDVPEATGQDQVMMISPSQAATTGAKILAAAIPRSRQRSR